MLSFVVPQCLPEGTDSEATGTDSGTGGGVSKGALSGRRRPPASPPRTAAVPPPADEERRFRERRASPQRLRKARGRAGRRA